MFSYIGVCDVQMSDDYPIIAVLGEKKGTVEVWTRNRRTFDQSSTVITAHESDINSLCLSVDGELLATASSKGSIIRVFKTRTGQCIGGIRRGRMHATIVNLEYVIIQSILEISD